MYSDGDYHDFYYDIVGTFPHLERKFGLQYSDKLAAVCVHLDEGFGATAGDAENFLKWVANDPCFVVATVEQGTHGKTWSFILVDDSCERDRIRATLTYFLPPGQYMPEDVARLAGKFFIEGALKFMRPKAQPEQRSPDPEPKTQPEQRSPDPEPKTKRVSIGALTKVKDLASELGLDGIPLEGRNLSPDGLLTHDMAVLVVESLIKKGLNVAIAA